MLTVLPCSKIKLQNEDCSGTLLVLLLIHYNNLYLDWVNCFMT